MERTTVLATYANFRQVERAAGQLLRAGFGRADFAVFGAAMCSTEKAGALAEGKRAEALPSGRENSRGKDRLVRFLVRAGILWLAGLVILLLPPLRTLLHQGVVLALLAGGAIGAVISALMSVAGGSPGGQVIGRYPSRIRQGAFLLSIQCDTPARVTRATAAVLGTDARNVRFSTQAPPAAAASRGTPTRSPSQ